MSVELKDKIEQGILLGTNVQYRFQRLKETHNRLKSKLYQYGIDIEQLEKDLETQKASISYVGLASDYLYDKVFKSVSDFVTSVLQRVFPDKNYAFYFEVTFKRNSKQVIPMLVDNDRNISFSLQRSVGQGIRTVVAFAFQYFCLKNLLPEGYPLILFYDEYFSAISEQYTGEFFNFISELTNVDDLYIINVTHTDRFLPYANKIYSVSDGIAREIR